MAEKHLTDGTTALTAQPRVIKIEAAEKSQNAQLRVAAYTRVSSDSDDQRNSFAAQNRYYAELISGKAEWRMVDIYADEGKKGGIVFQSEKSRELIKKLGNVVFAAGSRTELYQEPKIGESRNAFHFMKHHTTSRVGHRSFERRQGFEVLSLPHFKKFVPVNRYPFSNHFLRPGG